MKKGISLIVLIITIIVIIILASAVILSLNNTNVIGNSKKAVLLSNIDGYKSALNLKISDLAIKSSEYPDINVSVGKKENGRYVIKDYISQMTDEHANVLGIKNNELVLTDNIQNVIKYEDVKGILRKESEIQNENINPPLKVEGFNNNGNDGGAVVMEPTLYGMIPVKVQGNQLIRTNSNDKDWYKYAKQTEDIGSSYWANAVTQDGSCYFVWIPRYAYKFVSIDRFNNEVKIDVIFIDTNDRMENGELVPNDYKIHPAFNIPGKKLSGIWVGKYETSTDNNNKIEIKPGVKSSRIGTIAYTFDKCYNMQKNSIYRFNNIEEGSTHMLKNMEWGAVVYLAYSQYGRVSNFIEPNLNKENITGTFKYNVKDSWNTVNGVKSSSTKNISGIYDLSGGLAEYVAGNYMGIKDGQTGSATEFDKYFNSKSPKYFNIYSEYSNENMMNEMIGDSTVEAQWHNLTAIEYINGDGPWYIRGSNYNFQYASSFFAQNNDIFKGGGYRVAIFGK